MKRKHQSYNSSTKEIDPLEKLDAMGTENEREGIKWTKYFMDQFDRSEWEKNQIQLEKLDRKARFSRSGYHHLLAMMMNEEAKEMDFPEGYLPIIYPTKQGVVLEIIDRSNNKHRRAFTPVGIPKIDHHAVTVCLIQAQNTIDTIEEKIYKKTHTLDGMKKTESGIILGN